MARAGILTEAASTGAPSIARSDLGASGEDAARRLLGIRRALPKRQGCGCHPRRQDCAGPDVIDRSGPRARMIEGIERGDGCRGCWQWPAATDGHWPLATGGASLPPLRRPPPPPHPRGAMPRTAWMVASGGRARLAPSAYHLSVIDPSSHARHAWPAAGSSSRPAAAWHGVA